MGYSKKLDEYFNELSLVDFCFLGQILPLSKANKALKEQCAIVTGYIDKAIEGHKKNFNKGKATSGGHFFPWQGQMSTTFNLKHTVKVYSVFVSSNKQINIE